MDFTFIFLVILMLLAAKNGLFELAGALLILAGVTAKNKYSLIGVLIAAALLAALWLGIVKETGPEIIIVGVFIIFLISVKGDDQPPPGYGYPQMPY